MATIPTVFTNFIFLLLLHLGCFFLFPSSNHHHRRHKPTEKLNKKPLSSTFSFIKQIFTKPFHKSQTNSIIHHVPPSPASSTRSFHTRPASLTDSDFLPLRNDIYPCTTCGQIFQKPNLLDQHQALKHAVSNLSDDDPGNNIVRIIFQTGWPGKTPIISRVMKIHNSPKIMARFEDYRETVKSKSVSAPRRDERCIADGNELLRFHCTTFLCELGQNGNSSVCSHQYCSVCGIIRVGFSAKMDGISTYATSWKAHVAVPEEIEQEFGFMHVKRAMLVCRVVAGRVGCEVEMGDKDDPGYDHDSLVGREDELVVFNPRAVLPCFVIVYMV